MGEKRYFISEASKLVGVEAHVLRYWEEQLELDIRRNEMGHRYYIEEDILLLQSIRQMMEKGIQLRAVKMMLPHLINHREDTFLELIGEEEDVETDEETEEILEEEEQEEQEEPKKQEEEEIEDEFIVNLSGLEEEEEKKEDKLEKLEATEMVRHEFQPVKENEQREIRMMQFREIMEDLIGRALRKNNLQLAGVIGENVSERVIKELDYLMRMKEEQEEDRYKRLDETIRSLQKARIESAATEGKEKKGKRFRRK